MQTSYYYNSSDEDDTGNIGLGDVLVALGNGDDATTTTAALGVQVGFQVGLLGFKGD